MAYRRSLATRAKVFTQQRITPSIPYLNHHEDRKNHPHCDGKLNSFIQSRSYGAIVGSSLGFRGDPTRRSQFGRHVPMTTTSGFLLATRRRSMSTNNLSMEVAIAAADCWLPVAAWQYAIDGIHVFTGLNWWASIAITTLVVKALLIPVMIYDMKIASIVKGEESDELDECESIPEAHMLCKQHGFSLFSVYTVLFIQPFVFVTSILAIKNMVDKVPSFKTDGASWFLDLTTTDPFYVLPCFNAYLFWRNRKLASGNNLENKIYGMALTVVLIPIIACMPKALLVHWITSNLCSLVYGKVINYPTVKQILRIQDSLPPPPNPTSHEK